MSQLLWNVIQHSDKLEGLIIGIKIWHLNLTCHNLRLLYIYFRKNCPFWGWSHCNVLYSNFTWQLHFTHPKCLHVTIFHRHPLTILCMFHETIWTHLLVLPFTHVTRLRIIIHLPDKSCPLCCSPSTLHCQSLAHLAVEADGWFTGSHESSL